MTSVLTSTLTFKGVKMKKKKKAQNQKKKLAFQAGRSYVHQAEKECMRPAEPAVSGSSSSVKQQKSSRPADPTVKQQKSSLESGSADQGEKRKRKTSRRDQKVSRTSPVRTRSRSQSQNRPRNEPQRSRSLFLGFPSSPDTSATAVVPVVHRNPKRCLSLSPPPLPTLGDHFTDSAGHSKLPKPSILPQTKQGQSKPPPAKQQKFDRKVIPIDFEFDPSSSDSDSEFPPLKHNMPKSQKKTALTPAAASAAVSPETDTGVPGDTVRAIDNMLEETEAMETGASEEGTLPPSPPPLPIPIPSPIPCF